MSFERPYLLNVASRPAPVDGPLRDAREVKRGVSAILCALEAMETMRTSDEGREAVCLRRGRRVRVKMKGER